MKVLQKVSLVVDFTGHGASWLCNNTFSVTEINGYAATGTVVVCTMPQNGTYWIEDQTGTKYDISITHGATQKEPWMSFTYNGGQSSGALFGKYQVVYKGGLRFFYTGGVLNE